ncbi:MAG: phosphate acetyltransferase [Coriobacteriia bacterium]|nr:phosphate acetyltransferase [Coriobacteriia bacterium]
MSHFMDEFIARAKTDKKTIVLPEGNDERILIAAEEVLRQGIADVVILGNPEEIKASGHDLTGATIIDPETDPKNDEYAALLYELRKKKGMTEEEAAALVRERIYHAIMMVKTGAVDGMVGGANCATTKILSPALRVIKTAPGAPMVSSYFIMDVPDCELGDNGLFLFADCALEVQPTSEKLAHIANMTGASYTKVFKQEPRIALLSHSSYGSAKNDDANKVVEAMNYIRENYPSLNADGELQLDAAIVPEIGAQKAPESAIAGKANVLIFPDIDAANIGYKLVQRLGKAKAYGPVLQGLAAPVNDLSRGCSPEDIVGVVAITCVQAQTM